MSGKLSGTYESFLARCIGGSRKEQEAFREEAKLRKCLLALEERGTSLGLQGGWKVEGAAELAEAYRKGKEAFEKGGDVYAVLPLLTHLVRQREEMVRAAEAAWAEEQRRKAEEASRQERLKREQEEAEARRLHEAQKAAAAAQKAAEKAVKNKKEWEAKLKEKKELQEGGAKRLHAVSIVCLVMAAFVYWCGGRTAVPWMVVVPIAMELISKMKEKGRKLEMAEMEKRLAQLDEAAKRALVANLAVQIVPIPGKNYMMGKYEVTQAQWEAVMDKNPAHFKGEDDPVENVSWNDCQEFLEKLNALSAAKESGLVFRLPTEEEWEFACRAGATGDYSRLADGTEITKDTLGQVAWFEDNSAKKTHPVGQKKPNAFGLYDMHGNVWEWTSTFGHWEDIRVACGGCWDSSADRCQSCGRDRRGPPSSTYEWVGFRLAMSMSE